MSKPIPLPPQQYLRECFDYDPETGALTRGGDAVGCTDSRGRLQVSVQGRTFLAHRVIYKWVHGHDPEQVDHINGKVADNRLSNLRAVSNAVNQMNQSLPAHNNTGVMGVHPEPDGRWRAKIQLGGKQIYLGVYETKDLAAAARKGAERALGFHENHGRRKSRITK